MNEFDLEDAKQMFQYAAKQVSQKFIKQVGKKIAKQTNADNIPGGSLTIMGATGLLLSGASIYAMLRQVYKNAEKNAKDLCQFRIMRNKSFKQIGKIISQAQFKMEQIAEGKKYVCFIGPTSTGKTTLCNALFNMNLPIGMGQTTQVITKVAERNNTIFWDMPAMNDSFKFYRDEQIGFLTKFSKIFIVYRSGIHQVQAIASLLHSFNLTFVRTHCDNYQKGMKTIKMELQKDKADLKNLGAQIQHQIKYDKIIAVGHKMYKDITEYILTL